MRFDDDRNQQAYDPFSEKVIVSNFSGYRYEGSENFEHDDTGCLTNYSGVQDEVFSLYAEHEDWQVEYDY